MNNPADFLSSSSSWYTSPMSDQFWWQDSLVHVELVLLTSKFIEMISVKKRNNSFIVTLLLSCALEFTRSLRSGSVSAFCSVLQRYKIQEKNDLRPIRLRILYDKPIRGPCGHSENLMISGTRNLLKQLIINHSINTYVSWPKKQR